MILTVTLNAAIDKTYRVENFALDRVHRPSESRIVAGGKGINVSRVFTALGGEAFSTGFLGGYNGRFVERSLRRKGLASEFVRTRDESRICIAVVDPIHGTQTEVNEPGPQVTPRELAALKETFERLVRREPWSFVVLSGSAPPGVPSEIYRDLIEIAKAAGRRCVLDASGEPLKSGLQSLPWMVKPNIHELSYLLGRTPRSKDEIAEAALSLCRGGCEIVAVTRGRDGAIAASRGTVWEAAPPEIEFVSAVGSGDSFVGAFLHTLERGGEVDEALRIGVAAGAANAASYGAGFIDRADVESKARQVRLNRMELRQLATVSTN